MVSSDLKFASIDYYRAMVAIVEKIFEVVASFNEKFRKDDCEQWNKAFWKSFDNNMDMLRLNYDIAGLKSS